MRSFRTIIVLLFFFGTANKNNEANATHTGDNFGVRRGMCLLAAKSAQAGRQTSARSTDDPAACRGRRSAQNRTNNHKAERTPIEIRDRATARSTTAAARSAKATTGPNAAATAAAAAAESGVHRAVKGVQWPKGKGGKKLGACSPTWSPKHQQRREFRNKPYQQVARRHGKIWSETTWRCKPSKSLRTIQREECS